MTVYLDLADYLLIAEAVLGAHRTHRRLQPHWARGLGPDSPASFAGVEAYTAPDWVEAMFIPLLR